ncbi:hypothetical protein [Acetobacter fallax]|uniref:HTH IS21-type domain-containing protein n=1 Tax=Acetobacter fallax TaxID=1737473 RepID=A0ABX0KEA8_9PROT|nr:hypothetical protein [Acetobacter fallax]NHO34456.1 hypothetical protein [Acetobacter fallax]NHO38017.1 hypothetical protein [Acetobacter fallax]
MLNASEALTHVETLTSCFFGGAAGVLGLALLSVIRRWNFREQVLICLIARRTGLSRNTIRKYLQSDRVEPMFRVSARASKLDLFAERLSTWLRTESRKPRRQKRNGQQFYADLVSPRYDEALLAGCCLCADMAGGFPPPSAGIRPQRFCASGICGRVTV